MALNWRIGPLARGLECYRRGEFFEAHEHWEEVWLGLNEPEKSFLQALIQMSAAFHHLNRGNSAGSISLLKRTLRRLEACSMNFGGVQVPALRLEIRHWVRCLEDVDWQRPNRTPQITLNDELHKSS